MLSKEGMEGRTNGHYWCQRLMRLKDGIQVPPWKKAHSSLLGSHGRPFVIIAGHGIIRSPSKFSENL